MNDKYNNFKRISENRVSKILTLLDQMKNLKNTSFYEYSNDDIIKIFDAIEKEVNSTKKELLDSNDKKSKRFIL